jgi:hypothetical protein
VLPYYYWSNFVFALVTTFSCPVTNAESFHEADLILRQS